MIAVQSQNSGTNASVGWKTTDPITGSSPLEEYEPFGQMVSTVAPDDTPQANIPGSIDEIDWMCGMFDLDQFWDAPVPCQIAMVNGGDPYFHDAVFASADKESNPSKVAFNDSPIPDIGITDYSISDETTSYALASSSKKKKKPPELRHVDQEQRKRDKAASEAALAKNPHVFDEGVADPITAVLFADRLTKSDTYIDATIDASIYDSGNGYYIETQAGRDRLKTYIRRLITPECGKAFREAGLEKPWDALRNGHILFAARELLKDPNYNQVFGITEERRQFADTNSTANATTIPMDETTNGRATIFINGNAPFTETSNNQINDFVAHETVHALNGGVHPNKWTAWIPYFPGHDLSGWEPYQRVMDACGIR